MVAILSGCLVGKRKDIWGESLIPSKSHFQMLLLLLCSRTMPSDYVNIPSICSLQNPDQDHTVPLTSERAKQPQPCEVCPTEELKGQLEVHCFSPLSSSLG